MPMFQTLNEIHILFPVTEGTKIGCTLLLGHTQTMCTLTAQLEHEAPRLWFGVQISVTAECNLAI